MKASKSPEEVRLAFLDRGLSVSGWAKRHGFTPALVYRVLSGKQKPMRGESHRIAVALGIKEGLNESYDQLDTALASNAEVFGG